MSAGANLFCGQGVCFGWRPYRCNVGGKTKSRDGTASKERERNVAKIVGLKAEKDRIVYVNLDQIVTIEAIQGGSLITFANGEKLHVMTEPRVIADSR